MVLGVGIGIGVVVVVIVVVGIDTGHYTWLRCLVKPVVGDSSQYWLKKNPIPGLVLGSGMEGHWVLVLLLGIGYWLLFISCGLIIWDIGVDDPFFLLDLYSSYSILILVKSKPGKP